MNHPLSSPIKNKPSENFRASGSRDYKIHYTFLPSKCRKDCAVGDYTWSFY